MADTAETLESLIADVRSELGEPSPSFFTNEEITRWLNYGIQDFCRRTRILKGVKTYTWAANTDEVAMSTIFTDTTEQRHKIDMAEWRGSTGVTLLQVSRREVMDTEPNRGVTSTKGTPDRLYYSPWADKLGMQATPDVAGTLVLYYAFEPVKLINSTDPVNVLLNKWAFDCAAYAAYRGKTKDVDHFAPQEAQESLARFNGAIQRCRAELGEQDGPQLMGYVDDYLAPY